jgi:hypothetical protein
MVLLLQSALKKKTRVALTTYVLRRFGLTRTDKAFALTHLEKAGLIEVRRQHGKNPVVMLLPVEAS